MKMARDPLRMRYIRLIKGRYWYFRSKATGNVRLPGSPGEAEFHRAYAELYEQALTAGASKKERTRQRAVEARFFQKRRLPKAASEDL
jgi:hypothetical protein